MEEKNCRKYDNDEMLLVCVYCDSTDDELFSDGEIDYYGNLCELEFPEEIVREWYAENESDFVKETMDELGCSEEQATFSAWFEDVYTADDTDGLYWFALERGFKAERR